MSKEFWNERYKSNESVYGHQPNSFFKENIIKLRPGKLLLPAEGEGRNALYAASLGWQVDAFDYSEEARQKALTRAAAENLIIDYSLSDITEIMLPYNEYDLIGLVYIHLPETVRKAFHQKCIDALKPGGTLILEAFDKEQINNYSGGPREISMLYSLELLQDDFSTLDITLALQQDIFLDEGAFHSGIAEVVRLVASKRYL
jgi:SAM-dependent methyltransferase